MSDAVLALDAGQSGVRARAIDGSGPRQLNLAAVRTNTPVLPQLAERAAQAIAELWPDGAPAGLGLAVGSTGLATDETADALLTSTCTHGVRRVGLAHDSITCYLGALGASTGVMVAAGTGVVTLAVGPAGAARVDGWGNQLGDDGSGFWIGREGLRAVLRAYDGRGPDTALTPRALADFPHLDDAYLAVQRDPDWVRHIASFAKPIAELASEDAVCAGIIREAADHLATSARVALRRSGELRRSTNLPTDDPTPATPTISHHPDTTPPPADGLSPAVAAIGHCFDGTLLRETFQSRLRERLAGSAGSPRFVAPLGDALDGAATLFDLRPDNALFGQVRWAA